TPNNGFQKAAQESSVQGKLGAGLRLMGTPCGRPKWCWMSQLQIAASAAVVVVVNVIVAVLLLLSLLLSLLLLLLLFTLKVTTSTTVFMAASTKPSSTKELVPWLLAPFR
ncbi:unnamed protein product, partial [Polarella glacialis]